MLISIPFLVITFVVYASVKELKNLHGKCLMFYVASLIVLYADLSMIQLDLFELGFACIVAGFVIYFITLFNAIWLNIMAFNIWRAMK